MREKKTFWGIDLGGTKIECVVLDDSQQMIIRERIETQASQGYQHVINRIKNFIDTVSHKIAARPSCIGFSTPGAIDRQCQQMKYSNTTVFNGMRLRDDLEASLGVTCLIENDANCFGLAEARMGAVKQDYPNAQCVFAIIMGTGVGGSIIVNEQLLNGPHQLTGEWGHNVLDPTGTACFCGKNGCVETFISGPSLERYYHSISGVKHSLAEICQLADRNDRAAQDTLQRLYHYFGLALSRIINFLDPDVIVLGGGLSKIESLYTLGREQIKTELSSTTLRTPIIQPLLGDSAGVFGAAQLCVEH